MPSLRPATEKDFGFLYELHRESMRVYIEPIWGWHEDWQEEYFRAKFDPANRQIVQVDGKDVGVLVVEERPDEIYLSLIELLPAYQAEGIGSTLVKDLIRRSADLDRPLTLHVLVTNRGARRLYERLGFVVVETEPNRFKMTRAPEAKRPRSSDANHGPVEG